jgi:hypothetical protein
MRKISALIIGGLLLSGCAAPPVPVEEIVPEVPEVVEVEQAAPNGEIEACRTAWEAELEATKAGDPDDATLKETGLACPSFEVWEQIRDEVGYPSKSPNLAVAICALVEDARICPDGETD